MEPGQTYVTNETILTLPHPLICRWWEPTESNIHVQGYKKGYDHTWHILWPTHVKYFGLNGSVLHFYDPPHFSSWKLTFHPLILLGFLV